MKKFTKYILAALLIILPFSVKGQTLKTGYFVSNQTLRHTLNPAFAPDKGFIGLPILSSFSLDINSNLGASTLFYPNAQTGKLMTFLHPEVTAEQFLSNLNPNNYIYTGVDLNLFNFGLRTKQNSFWTFDLGVKVNVNANIPEDLFRFLKVGMDSQTTNYSIKNLGLTQDAYLQASLGYSRDLDFLLKGLRVGMKAKFLVGVDYAKINLDNIDIQMGEEEWIVNSNASAQLMAHGIPLAKSEEGGYITGPDMENFKAMDLRPFGYGVAFDFGVEYKLSLGTPVDGLTASFAVTDLGVISCSADNLQIAKSSSTITFSGVDLEFGDDSNSSSIGDDLEGIVDDVMKLAQLMPETPTESGSYKLNAKIFAGLEYPFLNNKMSVGLLYNARFSPIVNYNEFSFIYNLRPNRWFDLSLSYSLLNSHSSIGWLINFTPRGGINFFIGSDYTPLNLTPQYIPVDKAYANVQFGVSFPMGGGKDKKAKKEHN